MDSETPRRDKIIVQVDPELTELIPGFLANRRQDVLTIQDALAREDFETVRILAHSMRGVGGGYGFDAITEFGQALEQAAKEKNREEIRRGTAALAVYLARVEVTHEPHDKAGDNHDSAR